MTTLRRFSGQADRIEVDLTEVNDHCDILSTMLNMTGLVVLPTEYQWSMMLCYSVYRRGGTGCILVLVERFQYNIVVNVSLGTFQQ